MAEKTLVNLIPNYIYFYHLDKYFILPLYPDEITDQMDTKFYPTTALSRSAPVFTYANSGPRNVNITLSLHRDMINDMNREGSNINLDALDAFSKDDYVDTLVRYLQAAALPKYEMYNSTAKSVTPPMVAVRFGNDIFIKGIINSSIQVTYKKPIMEGNKYALISVTFTVYEVDPYDADTVAKEGSFRGKAAGNVFGVRGNDIFNS